MSTTLHPDAEIIDQLGGPSQLAKKLGFFERGRVQRVQNWKYRGIPEIVRLRRPDVFRVPEKAKRKAA